MTLPTRIATEQVVSIDLDSKESLDAIVEATSNARLVLLGEATHGDGATFAAKARIARHLYQHAGFDFLAWEAGSYDCWRMDEAFAAGRDPMEALALGVHGIWVAEETRLLAECISASHQTARPFRQVGFDTTFSSVTSVDTVAGDVERWVAELGIETAPEQIAAIELLANHSFPWSTRTEAEQSRARAQVDRLLASVEATAPDTFVCRVLRDVVRNDDVQPTLNKWVRECKAAAAAGAQWAEWSSESDELYMRCFGLRDTAMADNLLADMQRFPDARFIAWLANGHGIRNVRLIGDNEARFTTLINMGTLVHEALGDEAYMIATTSYAGTMNAGSSTAPEPVPVAEPESVEADLHAMGYPTAFVDVRSLPGDSPWRGRVTWRAWGTEQLVAPMTEITDGLLFIDQQAPSYMLPQS